MARGIGGAHRSKPARPPRSLISKTKVQPTGMPPTRATPARMPAGRVPASKMSARRVAAPAAVLRLCRCEKTHCGHPNQNYARRPHKEGNSFGHSLPHPQGIYFQFTPVRLPGSGNIEIHTDRKVGVGGDPSTSLAVKSVSRAFDAAHSFTMSRPVTSVSPVSGAVWNTSTSFRAECGFVSEHSLKLSRHRWSAAPWNMSVP